MTPAASIMGTQRRIDTARAALAELDRHEAAHVIASMAGIRGRMWVERVLADAMEKLG